MFQNKLFFRTNLALREKQKKNHSETKLIILEFWNMWCIFPEQIYFVSEQIYLIYFVLEHKKKKTMNKIQAHYPVGTFVHQPIAIPQPEISSLIILFMWSPSVCVIEMVCLCVHKWSCLTD